MLGGLSIIWKWSIRGGGSWVGVCHQESVSRYREAVPHPMYGFVGVARARHLSWCLDAYVYALQSTQGWGTCCQGVPRQGTTPTFASLKNQDWNFPEAHFLPLTT